MIRNHSPASPIKDRRLYHFLGRNCNSILALQGKNFLDYELKNFVFSDKVLAIKL